MAAHADVSVQGLRALYLDLCAGRLAVMTQPYTGEPVSPLLPPLEIVKPPSLMPLYAVIVLGALLIGSLMVVAISWARPAPADNAALVSAALVGVGVLMGQALTFLKSSQAVTVAVQNGEQVGVLHKSVNSGFEEFARLIRAEAREQGRKDAEVKQVDAAAIEARIAAAVDAAVARTLAANPHMPPTATATVNVTPEAVTVEEIKPSAAQSIADAVRPDVIEAVSDALPDPQRDPPPERGA